MKIDPGLKAEMFLSMATEYTKPITLAKFTDLLKLSGVYFTENEATEGLVGIGRLTKNGKATQDSIKDHLLELNLDIPDKISYRITLKGQIILATELLELKTNKTDPEQHW